MPTIGWSDDLSIDDSQIDFQHRQLLDAIGDLEDALAAGDPQRVAQAMPFLRLYAQVHFVDEERVLGLIGWPELAQHQKMHESFRQRLGELEGAVRRGDMAAGATLLGFLAAWLSGHIRGEDRRFAEPLRSLRSQTATSAKPQKSQPDPKF
ncbi:MAG: hemerythrin family protein [Planctomycetota bacterium]